MVGQSHVQVEWEEYGKGENRPDSIESDASLTGWGAVCMQQRTGGP